MLDAQYRAAQVDPIAQPRGEGIGHQLIAAFEPEQLFRLEVRASQLLDRRTPDGLQRAAGAAEKLQRGGGRTFALQQFRSAELIQLAQASFERDSISSRTWST